MSAKNIIASGRRSLLKAGILGASVCLLLSACGGGGSDLEAGRAAYADTDYPRALVAFEKALAADGNNLDARLALAETQEKLQDWAGAFTNFSAVAEADASNVVARFKTGQLLLVRRDAEGLRKVIRDLEEKAPEAPEGPILAAGLLGLEEGAEQALAAARKVLEKHPDDVNSAVMVASLLVRQGQTPEALDVLETSAGRNPQDVTVQSLLLRIHQQARDAGKARKVLETLIALEPKVLPHRVQLAALHEARKEHDEALAGLEEAVKVIEPPHSAAVAARLALVDFVRRVQGDEAALSRLEALVADAPEVQDLRMGLGRLRDLLRQPAEAAKVYEEVVAREQSRSTPLALEALTRLAAARALTGDVKVAGELVSEVLKTNPEATEALLLRGTLAVDAGKPAAAVSDLRAALETAPDSIRVLRALARALLAEGKAEEAVQVLKEAIERSPSALELRGELANLQTITKDLDGAIGTLDDVLKVAPGNQGALEGLFKIRMFQKNWKEAHAVADRLKTSLPDNPLGFHYDGLVYQAEGKPEASLAQFESALALAPDAIQPLSQLIRSHLAMGKREIAEKRLAEAIEQNADNFVAHNLSGELLLAGREPAKAQAAFERAIAINAGVDVFYRNLAAAKLALGEEEAALATLEQGIEATGGSALLVTALAGQLEATGKLDQAIAQYEKALEENPSSDLALNNLAMLLVEYRDGEEAVRRAQELVARIAARDNPAYLDTMGWIAYKAGDPNKAVALLEKAAAQLPATPMVQYHLGMAYLGAGNEVQARESLARSLEGNHAFRGRESAEATLAELERKK